MSKVILIAAQQSTGTEEDGPTSCCRQAYIDSISEAGALPLILPLAVNQPDIEKAFNIADGILLTGGSDLNPKLYGEKAHQKLGKTIKLRDQLETQLIHLAYKHDKAMLGICRGLQIINVTLGGTLYQDIPDQFESSLLHSQKGEDRWEKLSHSVSVDKQSRLYSIYDKEVIQVNSLHHQGIKRLSPKLKASARSEDGLIEAVEATDKKFLLAVQWHPEALWQSVDIDSLKLFKSFVASC